ncbi:MAG: zf-TFIIB domain-containing protein [Pyrinomonadaceae bacterium]|nr:zf-TFIIB domain-containing protein [Pyrinomonadaceae bacterium]
MEIEALNCPNCGVGVASDRTQCELCGSRLKTMACPSCLGLMFVGTRFCGHCGEEMVRAETPTGDKLGDCPRCGIRLEMLQIAETTVRECGRCDGLWADVGTFERLCSESEQSSAVLGFIGGREPKALPAAKISYVPCPDCGQLMNRSNFARASGVIIDICKTHGVWFDAGELPRIMEFIQKGGMEAARQKERFELEEQRKRLREEQRKFGLEDPKTGLGSIFEREDNASIRSFVRRLFD